MPRCSRSLRCSTASWRGPGSSARGPASCRTPVERSTYVLFSSLALLLLFWQWRPSAASSGGSRASPRRSFSCSYAAGLLIVLLSTFLINHFDLFGLRQVWLYLSGRRVHAPGIRTPFFYRYVRHPLYVGWLLTFWSAPVMTVAHLFFAVMTTAYILVAIQFEEADLVDAHGDNYRRYREQVPMLVPSINPAIRQPDRISA